jgi:hypothetical protein
LKKSAFTIVLAKNKRTPTLFQGLQKLQFKRIGHPVADFGSIKKHHVPCHSAGSDGHQSQQGIRDKAQRQ